MIEFLRDDLRSWWTDVRYDVRRAWSVFVDRYLVMTVYLLLVGGCYLVPMVRGVETAPRCGTYYDVSRCE